MIKGPIVHKSGINEREISFTQEDGLPIAELNLSWNFNEVTLNKIFVQHEYRRQGYGQRLLDIALKFSTYLKKPIWLYVLDSPEGFLKSWYQRNGFCGKDNFLVRVPRC